MTEWNIETLLKELEFCIENDKTYLMDVDDSILIIEYIKKLNQQIKDLEEYSKELELCKKMFKDK